MPPAPADPGRLLALGTALGPWQECARGGADEVLAHLVEIGDRDTQLALDAYLDTVADLLRELDASATDLAARLGTAAQSGPGEAPGAAERRPSQSDSRVPQ
jgi:hypothetical protein